MIFLGGKRGTHDNDDYDSHGKAQARLFLLVLVFFLLIEVFSFLETQR